MSSPDDALSPELLEALRRLAKAPVLLAAFDFDGTLTIRDSFTAFLRWRAEGLSEGADQEFYRRDFPTRPWPGPGPR